MILAYARISNKKQSIERQISNLKEFNKEIVIYKETYTGTKTEGREEFQKLLKRAKEGDTIVFDSVSRMSRNAEEGQQLYFELKNRGIKLVFLKEPYINTEVFENTTNNKIRLTGEEIADKYIQATNEVMEILARKQIKIAFDQAEKEVKDLQERTREGLREAVKNGVQLGRAEGSTYITKKEIEMVEKIKKLLPNHKDKEIIELLGITRNTYYKYKKKI